MRRAATVFAVLATLVSSAAAHQELYHNVDVDLVGAEASGELAVYFTIHAPELIVGFAEAADAMFDKKWLSERSDEELERILAAARVYLRERFAIAFETEGSEPVELGREVTFDDFDSIRNAAAKKELPPACLLATLRLEIPPGARRLRFDHAAESQKRLLLVVIRPKMFPDVKDVDAGEWAWAPLPEVARRGRGAPGGAIYTGLFVLLLGVMALLQVQRGRRLVKRKLVRRGGNSETGGDE